MGETKTPIFAIIRCAIRNPLRLIGQGVEMRAQLGKRHDRIDWPAVLDNVEVVGPEIHDARTVLARDISIADVPLGRHGPIKDRRPRRNLIDSERYITLEDRERLPHAVACNAATNWESSWMSASMLSPSVSDRDEHSSTALLFCHKLKFSSNDGSINALGSVLARWMTGWTAPRFDYTLLAQRLRNLQLEG